MVSLKKIDPAVLSAMYVRYSSTLLNYGIALSGNKELVKDCVQELFLNIWNQRENLSEIHSLKYYLLISLRRLMLRKLQNDRKARERETIGAEPGTAGYESSVQDKVIAEEDRNSLGHLLRQQIAKLPKRQREAIFLRYYEEMDYLEIASVMNLSYQGVRNLIYKSIRSIRQHIREEHQNLSA